MHCYSGGTEATELFPKVAEILKNQGLNIFKIAESSNPIYAIKYSINAPAIIGFSKSFDNPFNPSGSFGAVMTCSQADEGCPYIAGAEKGYLFDMKIQNHRTKHLNRMKYILSEVCKSPLKCSMFFHP